MHFNDDKILISPAPAPRKGSQLLKDLTAFESLTKISKSFVVFVGRASFVCSFRRTFRSKREETGRSVENRRHRRWLKKNKL